MEIVKENNPTTEQQAVIDQVAAWIDTVAIAEAIAEELVDDHREVTFEACKTIWLSVLEELSEAARGAIEYRL